jgi:hypothetical protein
MFEGFVILLDQPAQTMSLGFDDHADAPSEVLLNSPQRFPRRVIDDSRRTDGSARGVTFQIGWQFE